ncbi:MAG: beta-ketoacyl-ACP synthase III [Candidatus Cloacimonas sp.]|jgi:3-oxoacyl-[acyl-carrier-protein] synthase-3|nr:ketoacyl-ACP synthase III [Candidatus Cloacimonadota bacterium]
MSLYDAKIIGTGKHVPSRVLTNFDLEQMLDTSDEWITTRTGMKERRIASENEAASDLAYEASLRAIKAAGIRARDIDLIVVGTISPDYPFPSTACLLQKKLDVPDCIAFDLSAGCTGFIYAASVAQQFVSTGKSKVALVVGVEILTKITNWEDRNTAVLFGDGAGAVIMTRTESSDISKIIDFDLSADGTYSDLLIQPAGGSRMPATVETVQNNKHVVEMDGNKVYKLAVKSMTQSCELLLKRNNLKINAIDWLIPHQANLRIIEAIGKRLAIDPEKVIVTIEKYGNTSSSTIPIALDDSIRSNRIRKGDLVILVSFGAGLTSGGILFRY